MKFMNSICSSFLFARDTPCLSLLHERKFFHSSNQYINIVIVQYSRTLLQLIYVEVYSTYPWLSVYKENYVYF